MDFSKQREILKKPPVPILSKEKIDVLMQLCFLKDNALSQKNIDSVFMFGTPISLDKAIQAILPLVQKPQVRKLILTGGAPTYCDSHKIIKSEAELLYDRIKNDLPGHIEVYLEKESYNSKENVANSLAYLQNTSSVAIVTKNFASGRHYLTFKKFFPDIKIYHQSFSVLYPDSKFYLTKDDWFKHEEHLSRVWGEFLRIKAYGERGDIEFEEIRELVEKI